jgi:hypothetical protein
MDKRSFNLDVFPENDGVFLRFEAEDYGIEQSFVKYNENPAGFVENYCKKHCLGLMAKQLLLFKLQQKLSEISFCEKNVGNPGFFNDLIKTKKISMMAAFCQKISRKLSQKYWKKRRFIIEETNQMGILMFQCKKH